MTLDRRQGILVAAVIAALVLVGAVAVLAGGGDDEVRATERASSDDTSSTTDTTTAAGVNTPTTVAATEATTETTAAGGTAPAGAPPTTVATPTTAAGKAKAPPEDLGPAQDPGPATPPKPGTYTFRYEGEGSGSGGQSGSGEGESTTTITDISRQGGVVRQTVETNGGQFDSTNTVEWRPDSVLVARSIFRFGAQEADCDWTPDYLQAQLPLREGLTWEGRSSCTVTGFGVPITVERTTQNRVTGLERRRIAGRVLDLWVVESSDRITFADSEIRSQVTSWFSPPLGIIAASEGTAEGSGTQGSGEGRFSTELISLP